jgi:hypothetical protein
MGRSNGDDGWAPLGSAFSPVHELRVCNARATGSAISRRTMGLRSTSMTPAAGARSEDDPHDLEKPRGKQTWRLEPHGFWYPRTTGIWQTVWVESGSEQLRRLASVDTQR